MVPDSGLLVGPETDPDEFELLLRPLGAGRTRAWRGETGEPRSSSLKSGLFCVPLTESNEMFLNRVEREFGSGPGCDILGGFDLFVIWVGF